ncbi:MAG TPA: cupredoxin family copper-binding protein [Bacteroidales bacterium]|nr:cupredoxin family copper-binding protein [Bacteroidales bacterium]
MKTSNRNEKKHRFYIFPVVVLVLFLIGCSNTNVPTVNQVTIKNMAFSPATLTVTSGTTVTWVNKDAMVHTVTSSNGVLNSGNLTTNKSYSYTFNSVGTINYYCSIHPSMIAKVIVTAYVAPAGGAGGY